MQAAKIEFDAASIAFDKTFDEVYRVSAFDPSRSSVQVRMELVKHLAVDPKLVEPLKNLELKLAEYEAAEKAFDVLNKEFTPLAQYNEMGEITGGKRKEILTKLVDANLKNAARAEVNKIGAFYAELHLSDDARSDQARWDAMQAIISPRA